MSRRLRRDLKCVHCPPADYRSPCTELISTGTNSLLSKSSPEIILTSPFCPGVGLGVGNFTATGSLVRHAGRTLCP